MENLRLPFPALVVLPLVAFLSGFYLSHATQLTSRLPLNLSFRQSVEGDGYGGAGFTILPLLEEEPCTVIILHGLGGTGEEWGILSLGLSYFSLNFVKFIIPSASNASVTYLNQVMPSWFDIFRLTDSDVQVDRPDLLQSVARVNDIIDGEIATGVPPERIFVVGFSQGGALALTTFLRFVKAPLGGCIAVATWLPLQDEYGAQVGPNVTDSDVLMIHGTRDEAVDVGLAAASAQRMRQLGLNVTFDRIRGAPHIVISADVIQKIETFITDRAAGTTQYLRGLVTDLTSTFGRISANFKLP